VIHGLYSLLWRLALLPAWLWWSWRSRGQAGPQERGRWRERLAWCRYPAQAQDGVLVHAASIGEGVAAAALVRALRDALPQLPLLLTCTSFTGARRLRHELGEHIPQAFLPFDTPGAMARLLDRARPRVLVLMETELWPNLLQAARDRAIPVVLANARLSARSARAYARAQPLSRPMLEGLAQVHAQTRSIARRFRALGVPADRLSVAGNLKADLRVPEAGRQQALRWRQRLGSRVVLVAASTHAGEDEALLQAWPAIQGRHPQALLVLVPRHPQRFEAVAGLIAQHGHAVLRHSRGQAPVDAQAGATVWLADTLGEMLAWMALADIAFIGGSLVPHGGHSPLEAMVFGCPIASGRHVRNFADTYRALDRASAVAWVDDGSALGRVLGGLLDDPAARASRGRGGRAVFEQGAGAAVRSAQRIADLLLQGPGAVQRVDQGGVATWIDTAAAPLPSHPFDAACWQALDAWEAAPGGRGSAGFLTHGAHGAVLRHYRRGGHLARLLGDVYFGCRPERSRAMREFALLQHLRLQGLPVPRPVGARVQRLGACRHRADIIVERIPTAGSLGQRLLAGQTPVPAHWQALGAAIRQMHDAQVDHVDLNAHNLLLDAAGQAWLIDFDRCRRRPGNAWKTRNLQRLQRSLRKLSARHPPCGPDAQAGWPWLLEGYRAGGAGLRAR
jgi:3-deoxy-D-manno-octulosonic-acid transferase